MRTLEEIADDFEGASIRELLLFAADPFDCFGYLSGGIPPEIQAKIAAQIELKFSEGSSLLQKMRNEIGRLDQSGKFTPFQIHSNFELVDRVMRKKPAEIEAFLIAAWRHLQNRGNKPKEKEYSDQYVTLAPYTHEWTHTVVRGKKIIHNDFSVLETSTLDGVLLFQRDNLNSGNLNYPVYAWIQRTKSKARIIDKLVERVLERVEYVGGSCKKFYDPEVKDEKRKYTLNFSRDTFGVKIITLFEKGKSGVYNHFQSRKSVWGIEVPEEKVRMEEKGLSASKGTYLLRYGGADLQSTELVQLILLTYPEFLQDDYFNPKKHEIYKIERAKRVNQLRATNPQMYESMVRNIRSVLC